MSDTTAFEIVSFFWRNGLFSDGQKVGKRYVFSFNLSLWVFQCIRFCDNLKGTVLFFMHVNRFSWDDKRRQKKVYWTATSLTRKSINLLFSVVLFSGWLYCGSSVSTLFLTGLIFLDAVWGRVTLHFTRESIWRWSWRESQVFLYFWMG